MAAHHDLLEQMLAEKDAEDKAIKFTQAEINEQAKFLLGWARGAKVTKFGYGPGACFYKKGKFMVSLKPAMIEGLLKSKLVIGDVHGFTVDKAAVEALDAKPAKKGK